MDIIDIKENFWLGTQAYLQYLVDNDLSTEKIGVISVVPPDNSMFMLKTRSRIFDECGIEFEIKSKKYTLKSIHVAKNDKRRNILIIQVEKDALPDFSDIKNDEIFIISDLKFLVSRVGNWYDNCGNSISIPENPPALLPPEIFESAEPSDCQKAALKMIFSQPMSYIWGAPGTGKTGFVLANSILNYLKCDYDPGIILLTAPTNAALEQTLFRLLPILCDNGISLSKIIRLGQPSRNFAESYPDVCENMGIQYETDDTVEIIDALKRYKVQKEKINFCEDENLRRELKKTCETLRKIYTMCDFDNVEVELKKYNEKLKELKSQMLPFKIENELSVIACTVDTYIGKYLNLTLKKSKRGICHVFLDEACYCNLVKALTLFACNAPVTFLGDHMQLPPVCEMPDEHFMKDGAQNAFIWAQSAIYAENVFYEDMMQMFEEYLKNAPPHFDYMQKADLNFTHRFGSGLTEILERHVYQNNFMSAIYDETEIICINVAGNYSKNNRENMAEVRAIERYLELKNPEDYVVLTPYRNQVKLLSERLKRNVMTVHKSQGQEWDTVILSVTDTKNKFFTDTLTPETKGLQLINTAVSRAKKRLVIVCDAIYWQTQEGQMIKDLVDISKIVNNIFGIKPRK